MKKDLRWKYEYKYRIPRLTAESLAKLFPSLGLRPDPHATAGGEYYVTSIYFDSPGLGDYYDKAGGFKVRKKIRGRIYSPWQNEKTKEVRFEVKWRDGLHIAKEGLLLSHREWDRLIAGNYSELLSLPMHERDQETFKIMLWHVIRDSMRPRTLVKYLRRPFVLNDGGTFRVTLDHHIVACEKPNFWYTPFVTRVLPDDEAIMEVKFSDTLPRWYQDLIYSFNLKRISYSKYASAVDAVRAVHPLPR